MRPTRDAPLSPAQRSVWIANDLLGGGVFNLYRLTWLHGRLDLVAFGECLDDLVRRHEILRTTVTGPGNPRQVADGPSRVGIAFRDLTMLPAGRRAAEALRLAEGEVSRPFDTACGPLFRVAVTRVGDQEHLLALTLHHLVADEWGLDIFIGELGALYAARVLGHDAQLPPLAIQFGDYAHWQTERLAGGLADQQLAFWRQALSDVPHVLELPTDKPRPPRPSNRGLRASRVLTPELTAGFRRLAAGHGVTAFTAMIAIFGIVLSRHAGQQRFAVGTAGAGRNRTETESLIGLFANLVAVPLDVPADSPVADVLRGTGAAVLSALDHQDVPFDRVLAELSVPRSMSRNPIYQVVVQWGACGQGDWQLPGITTEAVSLPFGSAKADLTLVGTTGADTIEFELIGEAGLFDTATLDRLLGHFVNAVAQVVADPAMATSRVDLTDASERQLLTGAWAGSAADQPPAATLGRLFERVAEEHPQAIALDGGDGYPTLTYRELDEAANRLARVLLDRGVGPDHRVGLALPRSPELVLAMLAVAKAGGACLGLDPGNPPARNALLARDADPVVIVSDTANLAALEAAGLRDRRLILDDPAVRPDLAGRPVTAPLTLATKESLAHICYTSGSTGTPKGVGLTHRGIVRLARGHHPESYGPGQTGVLLAPIAFDVSLMEIWGTLLNGGRLVVPPAGKLDVPDLAALLREQRISTLVLITPMFHQLVRQDPAALAGVRHLLIGGDAIDPEAFAAAMRAYPGLTVTDCYGPTENTTITTSFTAADPGAVGPRVPIGRPVPHTTAYVLDERLAPVPVGVTGELYTGGHGLARGYLGRPASTADRFLPDPYSGVPGTRMYRTGDLARWRETGVLDFLGRADDQVKIRGFRIEPGEIQARLTQHPCIAEAAVVAQEDHSGHKRLAAYLVAAPGVAPDHPELAAAAVKRFIQQALPEYMTPAGVTVLPRLPLTPHGKVDRAALPVLAPAETVDDQQDAAPRTSAEETLVRIWQDVLGAGSIGIHDNFFDLGGDSILSIRIAAQARESGIPVTSAHVFDRQTIAELAELAPVAFRPEDDTAEDEAAATGEVPMTPVQCWFAAEHAAGAFNQAVRLAWDGPVDPGTLRRALDAVLAQHDALRLRLHREGSGWHQHIAALEAADLLEVVDLPEVGDSGGGAGTEHAIAAGEAADRAHERVDAANGPLVRAVLLRGYPGGDQVIVVVHHLAVDTVSWDIILDDLAAAYRNLAAGQPARLPAKTASFGEWARKLAEHAQSPGFAGEARFWRDYPGAAPPLPVDSPGGPGTAGDAAFLLSALDVERTRILLRTVPRATGAHINDILLTALAMTLRGWTGRGEHVIDLEGHGREVPGVDLDVSRTVGWFTSIHPVRLSLPPSGDPLECLAAVRDRLLAIPGRGTGYGVARYLRRVKQEQEQEQQQVPQPAQLIFNYHGQLLAGPGRGPRRLLADAGTEIGPLTARRYLIETSARVRDGSLRVGWSYPPGAYREETMAGLAGDFIAALAAIVDACPAAAPAARQGRGA